MESVLAFLGWIWRRATWPLRHLWNRFLRNSAKTLTDDFVKRTEISRNQIKDEIDKLASESRHFQNEIRQVLMQSTTALLVDGLSSAAEEPKSAGGSPRSQLAARDEHFREEKELLGQKCVDYLVGWLQTHASRPIIVLLDAGSTVLPIFQRLCRHPAFQHPDMAKRVHLVTNNLGGTNSLLELTRIEFDEYSPTKFPCYVPTGLLDSMYDAILGIDTPASLEDTVSRLKSTFADAYTIAFITGNYVSVTEGILARGEEHTQVKSMMVRLADESFLIAPLGKFVPFTAEQLTASLRSGKKYICLRYYDAKRPTLILTYRPDTYGGSPKDRTYFAALFNQVKDTARGVDAPFQFDDHWKLEVNPMELSWPLRLKKHLWGDQDAVYAYEFPHTRFRSIMKDALTEWKTTESVTWIGRNAS